MGILLDLVLRQAEKWLKEHRYEAVKSEHDLVQLKWLKKSETCFSWIYPPGLNRFNFDFVCFREDMWGLGFLFTVKDVSFNINRQKGFKAVRMLLFLMAKTQKQSLQAEAWIVKSLKNIVNRFSYLPLILSWIICVP